MYHIKKDKRMYKSADLLYQGLAACLKKEALAEISIADLQRASSVSRATFYRLFDQPIDILAWKCDQMYKKVMTSYVEKESHDSEEYEFLHYFFAFWLKDDNAEILEVLIKLKRFDIIASSHYQNSEILHDYFKDQYQKPLPNYHYHVYMRIGAFVALLIAWVSDGKKEQPDELVDIIKSDLAASSGQHVFI